MDIDFLTVHDVVKLNAGEIGVKPPNNILKMNELKSAVNSIKATMFGNYLYSDIFEMASNLTHHIAMSHVFVDGNKRTAYACGLDFLENNHYIIDSNLDIELADLLLDVVVHNKTVDDLTEFFRNNCVYDDTDDNSNDESDDEEDDDAELTDEEITNSLIINENKSFFDSESAMEYLFGQEK